MSAPVDEDDDVEVDVTAALFGLAARWFADTVAAVGPEQWERPGLGEWTVRELVGHTLRAMTTVEGYLVVPPEADELDIDLDDAGEYYRVNLAAPGIDEAVAARGREAGAALGPDPVATVEATIERVLDLVDEAPEGSVCRGAGGVIALEDYLVTRITELVLHTLDLRTAIDLPLDPPAGPAVLVLHVLAEVVDRADRGAVLLALAGRRPLPDGFSALRATAAP